MKKLTGFPFIRQSYSAESAICCLAMIFKFYGLYNVRRILNQIVHNDTQAMNYYLINRLGELFGFKTSQYFMRYDNLSKIIFPIIVRLKDNSFAVAYNYSESSIKIAHPATGKKRLAKEDFEQLWAGEIISLEPQKDIEKQKDVEKLIEKYKKDRQNLRKHHYWAVLLTLKGMVFQILGASLVIELSNLMLPFFVQIIIDKVLVHQNIELLLLISAFMFSLFLVQVILYFTRNRLLALFRSKFEFEFFSRFFEHFIRLRQNYFDAHKREEIITRFQQNLTIRNAFGPTSTHAIIELCLASLYIVLLGFYSFKLMCVALLFLSMYVVGTWYYSPKIIGFSKLMYEESSKATGEFLDILVGIQNAKILGIEHILMWKWQNQYSRNMNSLLRHEDEKTSMFTTLRTFHYAGMSTVYWVGAYLTFEGEMTIGEYIAFTTIFTMVLAIMNRMPVLWSLLIDVRVAFQKINELLAEPKENEYFEKNCYFEQAEIEIKNLKFAYQDPDLHNNPHYILKNLNLYIPYGKYVGIVGRNGSGKTTLVKVLAKLYENYEGEILINGQPISEMNTQFYRKKVLLFPQQIHVFNDSIKNNILYGNPEATIEQIIEAAKLADLHDFISQNPQGYDLQIGEGGNKLSGGQQLKVAFARLFLADPQVIILDEASSALDVATEQKIMRNIFEKFKGRTIISIAHRLNTLRNADMLLVIERGEVVETGTHYELMDSGGVYAYFMKTYVDF